MRRRARRNCGQRRTPARVSIDLFDARARWIRVRTLRLEHTFCARPRRRVRRFERQVREQIGPRVVTEPRIELREERRGLHEIRLLADELDHFFEQIAIGPDVEGRVVEANQVPIFGATTDVRVRGLEPTRSRTVLTGIDQGFDGPDFSAEFDPSHVSLTIMMPFSAENRHLGVRCTTPCPRHHPPRRKRRKCCEMRRR